jgi:putative FmdB family regulatory protein
VPLYEYECRSCGTVTDIRHGFDETVSEACPACGGELVRRFSATGIVFKGSGFYITDSRKAAGGSSGKSRSTSDTGPAEKAASEKGASETAAPKTDAAPAAKPEAKSGESTTKGSAA